MCLLIEVLIPAERKFAQKETQKKLKYESLCIEIHRMWNMKCMIIPVMNDATRVVTKDLKKNLEAITGNHSIDSLQRTAVGMRGTSDIKRKVMQPERG
jgi:hypothetical protein